MKTDDATVTVLVSALQRAIAMAHLLGDATVHPSDVDWPDCGAPVCREAQAAIAAAHEPVE